MAWFFVGVLVGVIAAFFVFKNNQAQAKKLFDQAETMKADADAAYAKAVEKIAELEKKIRGKWSVGG